MSHPPTIRLRPFTDSDVPFFAGLARDERVMRFVGDGQPWDSPTVTARVSPALEQVPVDVRGAVRWFVALEERAPVGVLVATRRDAAVEIGYWVAPEHWGRGIAGVVVDHALTTIPRVFDCTRLSARVSAENTASARVLTRRGFDRQSTEDGLDHYTWVMTPLSDTAGSDPG